MLPFVYKLSYITDEHELIQKRTFTNWVNSCISTSSEDGRNPVPVDDLYVDFKDGHILVTLIRTLSGDNLVNLYKNIITPHACMHKHNNVCMHTFMCTC